MMVSKTIYLDNAATTPLLQDVYEAMHPFLFQKYGNPSSIYSLGRETRIAIEKTRQIIADELQCSRGEIIFTSSGTESINKALWASIVDLQCKRIITSPIEHHATLHIVDYLQKQHALVVDYVQINPNGHIDLDNLEYLLQKNPSKTIVSLLHANNEIGNLTNAQKLSHLCQHYNALLHLDTVQTIGHYKINLQNIKVDFLSCSAHKFHGPKGVGFIYINASNKISPLLHGGSQERNMRAGTENVAGIVGLGKAFQLAYQHLDANTQYIYDLKQYAKNQLTQHFPHICFFGDTSFDNALYTILNVGFPQNPQTDMLTLNLDINNICVSSGSACSSGTEKGSHVIQSLNLSKKYQPVRFSFSHLNNKQEIDMVIQTLQKLL